MDWSPSSVAVFGSKRTETLPFAGASAYETLKSLGRKGDGLETWTILEANVSARGNGTTAHTSVFNEFLYE